MRRGLVLGAALALAGCNSSDPSMTAQPKQKTYAQAPLWPDGSEARPLPDHVVAHGDGALADAAAAPPPISAAVLARGHERYDIFCAPCHGLTGHGDGMIVARGFPAPPDYDSPRLRAADAAHIFDVITRGYGVMYSYAARVPPDDRWAIVAYVRALQTRARIAATRVPDIAGRLP